MVYCHISPALDSFYKPPLVFLGQLWKVCIWEHKGETHFSLQRLSESEMYKAGWLYVLTQTLQLYNVSRSVTEATDTSPQKVLGPALFTAVEFSCLWLSHLCDVQSTVAVTCSLLLPSLQLSHHGSLPWPGRSAGHPEGPSGLSWAIKELAQEVFTLALGLQEEYVCLMPFVCSCAHCPLELKVGCFYSRSFEGVCSGECHHSSLSESTISSAYVYTHTHTDTHIYIMFSYLYFSCKKLSLYWWWAGEPGCKDLDMTEWLNWTDLCHCFCFFHICLPWSDRTRCHDLRCLNVD